MSDPNDNGDSSSSDEEELTFSSPEQKPYKIDAPSTLETDESKKRKKKKKKKSKKEKKKRKSKKNHREGEDDDDDDDDDDNNNNNNNDDDDDDDGNELSIGNDENQVAAAAQINVDSTALAHTAIFNQSIPKKKRSNAHSHARSTSDRNRDKFGDESGSEEGHIDEDVDISLNDLKRKVMGRDLRAEEDVDQEQDEELRQIQALMNTGPETEPSSTKTIADKLRRDLMCTICHDIIYPPISLFCGHSFCQPCIEWWFDTSKIDPSCPTCRKTVPVKRRNAVAPNLALRSCIMAIYGPEIVRRIQECRPKGERGGAHGKGYEVISHLEDETWHYIQTTTNHATSSTETIQVRRNIVLDADDQRMQLALAVYERPQKIVDNDRNGFHVKLCLLTMEEDEAADSGFPSIVDNSEDEQLICGRESRFLHSILAVQMRVENGSVLPLARISSAADGCFDYMLDPSTSVGDPTDARGLLFEHTSTGCRLEIDLAQLQSRGGSSLRPHPQPIKDRRNLRYDDEGEEGDDMDREESNVGRRTVQNLVMGQSDDSDMSGSDEFEDDGFLVDDNNQTSDVEGEFSSGGDGDDEDVCTVCHGHGELMVCDGGEEDDGCGKAFHAACVNRSQIPEGDWICQECANSFGIAVGLEGHEFKAQVSNSKSAGTGKRKIIDDESDGDADEKGTKNCGTETDVQPPKTLKRRMVLLDDSESE
ncbi:zinc finger C3HC4 type domain containing protein [Nitzschia inconspicua]|uniref:Zinc finger C3HC4 type domain containing protein n=1 Tax=Nitzschia inconspicua TaxID=303405 RepID=A0A9K3Q5E7_9STRA|nr:zinc finger C3HC4 type domain containing protein [Nitzschia inconspicua]